jgi:hypothetical protein
MHFLRMARACFFFSRSRFLVRILGAEFCEIGIFGITFGFGFPRFLVGMFDDVFGMACGVVSWIYGCVFVDRSFMRHEWRRHVVVSRAIWDFRGMRIRVHPTTAAVCNEYGAVSFACHSRATRHLGFTVKAKKRGALPVVD